MAKTKTGNGMLKEAMGILIVVLVTGLILVGIFLISRCDGKEEVPDPHNGGMESAAIIDNESGIKYLRCPIGIGANTLKDVYISMGDINFYTIAFEDPKRFVSEAKNVLGGSYVYRSTDTEEITLQGFAPVSAGVFMGDLSTPIDHFYSKDVAEKNGIEDGSKYTSLIEKALKEGKQATPTGELSEENEFYIRLYSENYPGLYYEVFFCTDENGVAYLLDMVTDKMVLCPDELTVRMIG